jgi:hypothetical protein
VLNLITGLILSSQPETNTKNSRNLHSRTASPPLHIPISGTNSKKSSGATYTSPHSVLIEKRKISEERYIYPAERKTPTYGLQKYRVRKKPHFWTTSSPSQGLDCTLSWPRWPHSLWKIQHTGQKHYLAAHPPGIEEIRRLTFQYSGQKESTYQDSLPSSAHSYIFTCHLHPPSPSIQLSSEVNCFCLAFVAHSDPQAQILKFLSRCWKINYRRCIPWDNKTVPHIPAFRASSSSQTIEKRNHKGNIYPAERKLPLTYTKSSSARKVQHTRPFEHPLARCWKLIHRPHSSCFQAQEKGT